MKILVLGASGHIGARLLEMLRATPWAVPTGASRRMRNDSSWLEIDSRDPRELAQALEGFDAVVNCVAGDAASIAGGARALVQAALEADCRRIVHLSTMSVYGPAEGNLREEAPLGVRGAENGASVGSERGAGKAQSGAGLIPGEHLQRRMHPFQAQPFGPARCQAQAALPDRCVASHTASLAPTLDLAARRRWPRFLPPSLLSPSLGWYGRAKCEAEAAMRDFVQHGGEAVLLRPGCVYGPGSQLWVGRIGRWLQAGRLGDLGIAGDGWSNLVHVDDVCQALLLALQLPVAQGEMPVFNLAAPDSPRWNDYFVDLALEIKATPVRRINRRQLQLDAWACGPPLKVAERALKRLGSHGMKLPDALPPGLLGLWSQHIHLDAQAATGQLGVQWTPYADGLRDSAQWFCASDTTGQPALDNMICTP